MMQINDQYFEQTFLGELIGIGLFKRGENDNHVCFQILVEDDGAWYPFNMGRSHGVASGWLPELLNQLKYAEQWMEENCKKEGKGYSFR